MNVHFVTFRLYEIIWPFLSLIASTKTKQGKFLFTVITINIFITSTGIVVRASGLPDLVTSAHQRSEGRIRVAQIITLEMGIKSLINL